MRTLQAFELHAAEDLLDERKVLEQSADRDVGRSELRPEPSRIEATGLPLKRRALTLEGTGMGCLPMRLMRSPDLRDDLAAHARLTRLVAGHHAA